MYSVTFVVRTIPRSNSCREHEMSYIGLMIDLIIFVTHLFCVVLEDGKEL